jgi:hypothetical protein
VRVAQVSAPLEPEGQAGTEGAGADGPRKRRRPRRRRRGGRKGPGGEAPTDGQT